MDDGDCIGRHDVATGALLGVYANVHEAEKYLSKSRAVMITSRKRLAFDF